MFESEQETRKLYIAAHANPILHMLPELLRNTERAVLGVQSGRGFTGCVNCSCCR